MKRHEPILDILRFIAATFVVIFHTGRDGFLGNLIDSSVIQYLALHGDIGVDIFFIISGYVIFQSAQGRDSLDFLIARCVRILPTFLLATSGVFILSQFGMGSEKISYMDFLQAITLTFQIDPLDTYLPVLWTLVYEIKFYGAITIILEIWPRLLGKNYHFLFVTFLYCTTLYALFPTQIYDSWTLGHYGYLFSIGISLKITKTSTIIPERIVSILFLATIYVFLFDQQDYQSPTKIILLATALIIMFPFNRMNIGNPFTTVCAELGAISYPLYLIHFHFMFFVLRHMNFLEISKSLFYCISYVATLVTSFVVVKYFERPMQKYLITIISKIKFG